RNGLTPRLIVRPRLIELCPQRPSSMSPRTKRATLGLLERVQEGVSEQELATDTLSKSCVSSKVWRVSVGYLLIKCWLWHTQGEELCPAQWDSMGTVAVVQHAQLPVPPGAHHAPDALPTPTVSPPRRRTLGCRERHTLRGDPVRPLTRDAGLRSGVPAVVTPRARSVRAHARGSPPARAGPSCST